MAAGLHTSCTCIECSPVSLATAASQLGAISWAHFEDVDGRLVDGDSDRPPCRNNVAHYPHHNSSSPRVETCKPYSDVSAASPRENLQAAAAARAIWTGTVGKQPQATELAWTNSHCNRLLHELTAWG